MRAVGAVFARRSSLLVVLALAGCGAPGLPLGPTVRAPVGAGLVQGEADLIVRTFAESPDGSRREVGGAICAVTALTFEARLTTPARFIVPSYGPQSATLDFDCRAGDLRGGAQQGVVTRWLRQPGGWTGVYSDDGFTTAGYLWGGAWGGPAYPVFVYPDVDILLRAAGGQAQMAGARN